MGMCGVHRVLVNVTLSVCSAACPCWLMTLLMGQSQGAGRGQCGPKTPAQMGGAHPGWPQAQRGPGPPCRFDMPLVLCKHLTELFSLFQANIGQTEDFDAAQKKALALGAKKVPRGALCRCGESPSPFPRAAFRKGENKSPLTLPSP